MSRAAPNAKPAPPRRWWRVCRTCFRWCRIVVWLLLLGIVIAGLYLHQVGLPDWVKRRAADRLQALGWHVDFSRLRLRWYHGIVAENLHLQRADAANAPIIFAELAECRLSGAALRNFRVEVDSVMLDGGRLVWLLPGETLPSRTLTINDVTGELRFHADDRWELPSLRGTSLGLRVQLSGTLTNASALRDWQFPERPRPRPATDAWRRIVEIAEALRFAQPPEVIGTFHGDARDADRVQANLRVIAPSVDSPWGRGRDVRFTLELQPGPGADDPLQVGIEAHAADAHTDWVEARRADVNLRLVPTWTNAIPTRGLGTFDFSEARSRFGNAKRLRVNARLNPSPTNDALRETEVKLTAVETDTRWGAATNGALTARWIHAPTNFWPHTTDGEVRLGHASTRWANAEQAMARFHAAIPPASEWALARTNLTWPERIENLPFDLTATFGNLSASEWHVQRLDLSSRWQEHELEAQTEAALYGGHLAATGTLHTASRELVFHGRSVVDPHRFANLLGSNAQRWFVNCAWSNAPEVTASGRVTLPAWTNRAPDWHGEVWPTLSAAGRFAVTNGAFRGVVGDRAESAFVLTNRAWRLPDLRLTRPEGELVADYSEDTVSRDFHARLHSRIDPKILKPFFTDESTQRLFDEVALTQPPEVEAEILGRWREPERLGVTARIAATNLSIRGEAADDVIARVIYTNQLLTILEPQVQHAGERGAADGLLFDARAQRLYITNAFGDLNSYRVVRVIGPATERAVAPYQFERSPTVRLNGVLDTSRGGHQHDLHFDISGGRFHWEPFHLETGAGRADWVGNTLTLTNVVATMHGGPVTCWMFLDFDAPKGPRLVMHAVMTNVDLPRFAADMSGTTNSLEGLLSGELWIDQAFVADRGSWHGRGHVNVRDGLLWDIPLFGIFSPVLNTLIPGLGRSRARRASAEFILTNSVAYTKDLEIDSAMMRMNYRGTIDFDRRVHARVQAELLRNTPGVGFVISKVLWPVTKIFDYRIGGTLEDPKAEPVFVIPALLLLPFHPMKALKQLFPDPEPMK